MKISTNLVIIDTQVAFSSISCFSFSFLSFLFIENSTTHQIFFPSSEQFGRTHIHTRTHLPWTGVALRSCRHTSTAPHLRLVAQGQLTHPRPV